MVSCLESTMELIKSVQSFTQQLLTYVTFAFLAQELERLAEQNDKISFHAEYEEEEEAWSKVTPVG